MYESPAPPYFSGKIVPRKPSSPILANTARGKCCASSHSMTWGRISASANSRAAWRIACCSAVKVAVIGPNSSAAEVAVSAPLTERRGRGGVDARGGDDVDSRVVVLEDRVVRGSPQGHPVSAVLAEADSVPPPAT